MDTQKKANRLIDETSPYLLQHAYNPVDWYAWNAESLSRAKSENKPILLSVGYSACHWCHVMEHESFENPAIAKLMNENFINIKVDREERPDLDQIYQNVSQLMTRSGGWPLTVFLTPDLRPFFGGTYFPPDDRYGRPGFGRLLQALSQAWTSDAQSVEHNAQKLTQAIGELETLRLDHEKKRASDDDFAKTAKLFLATIDWRNGGFGEAPKFPNTMALSFLWRYGVLAQSTEAQDAAVLSLVKMAKNGIFDQLGGGFHRYSVDEKWSVPHFEKMLYDNSLLLKLYAEVLLTDWNQHLDDEERALFVETLSSTTSYVLREMTQPEGGFYSTQDADSEGEEGKFFAWDDKELSALLNEEEFQVFLLAYGVWQGPNFEHGKTVLFQDLSVDEIAKKTSRTESNVRTLLSQAKQKLFTEREKRVKPGRDEKIITSWNGLMISGLTWAAQALDQNGKSELAVLARQEAEKAFSFITRTLSQKENNAALFSVYKDGKSRFNAYLDDYAFLAQGALDLSRFSSDSALAKDALFKAKEWSSWILKEFKDPDQPGFFFTAKTHEVLIQRPKTLFDQAIPSGTAIALQVQYILSQILEDCGPWEEEVTETLHQLFPLLEKSPLGMGELLCAQFMVTKGLVTVSNPTGVSHPHLYLKQDATQKPELLLCHQKTCRPTYSSQLLSELKTLWSSEASGAKA